MMIKDTNEPLDLNPNFLYTRHFHLLTSPNSLSDSCVNLAVPPNPTQPARKKKNTSQ